MLPLRYGKRRWENPVGPTAPPAAVDSQNVGTSADSFSVYVQHRGQLEAARQSSAALFDKYTLAGAGGAAVLSLSILAKVGAKPSCVIILLFSWLCLACSAGSVLLNFHLTCLANEDAIETADRSIKKNSADYRRIYTEEASVRRWERRIKCLNITALVTLALGVLLLLLFAGVNL